MPSSKDQDYEVEKVVGKRTVKGRIHYLIKWKGYSSDENTWEPESHVRNCQNLVKEFEAANEEKNKLKSSDSDERQGRRNTRTNRSSQSPPKTPQRPSRNSNRSLPNYKDPSEDDIFSEDEDEANNGHQEKKSGSPKRTSRNTNDIKKTSSIDSSNTDILDSDKLDHIVDVRRNGKRNIVEYYIQPKKGKKLTWINSNRLAEKYSEQVINFLEEKYV